MRTSPIVRLRPPGPPASARRTTAPARRAARLDDLAAQVRDALGGTAPTKVIVDSSLFSGPV
ncbi:hypothetical protein, partial [Micromonospora aurantiaca (nom. illeg.)]|uniref:hypothetical protein n=1 Tax=Micromonospora aurantiaca (nom. illeg.) TaxID=47850 RepID=UPI00381F5A55